MKCLVIGGITVDIEGAPLKKLLMHDSNLGKVKIKPGGVGRNIATNMSLMGLDTSLISCVGNDYLGDICLSDLEAHNISPKVFKSSINSTAIYLSILNEGRDMELALNDMAVIKEMDVEFFKKNLEYIRSFDLIVLDCNLEKEALDFLGESLKDKKLVLDTVSVAKANRAIDILKYIDSIKPNIYEAEVLTDTIIESEEDLKRAANILIEKGIKNVYITLDKDGVYYTNKDESGKIKPNEGLTIKSATGAGDSFTAAISLGISNNFKISDIANLGMAASEIAMESLDSVNLELTYMEMKRRIKNVR